MVADQNRLVTIEHLDGTHDIAVSGRQLHANDALTTPTNHGIVSIVAAFAITLLARDKNSRCLFPIEIGNHQRNHVLP